MYSKKKNNDAPKHKKLFILLGVVVALITALCILELIGATNFLNRSPNSAEQAAQEREKQDNIKGQLDNDNLDSDATTDTTTPGGGAAGSNETSLAIVSPIITQSGQYGASFETAGYVNGVYEDSGTCTFRLTSGSRTVTKTSTGVQDVSNTSCPSVTFPTNELSAGEWQLVLGYNSSTSTGSSKSETVTIR